MQQLPTLNFGLTKIFFFFYRTLSMRQKTKNYRIKGSNAKIFLKFFYFPSHIPIWVWFVQKTRAKNSHAWAPLRSNFLEFIEDPDSKYCSSEVQKSGGLAPGKAWRGGKFIDKPNAQTKNCGM
jgi:hypothetical protein